MSGTVVIGGRRVGRGEPPFLVAEMSGNHGGSLERALALVAAAKEAGADALKLQTYTADTITIEHDGPGFVIESGPWAGRRLYDLYEEAHTPWTWHEALFEEGRRLGLTVFSSPFDESAVDFLEGLGAPAYKIASFELVDLPLIERAAATGKPVILSTGLAAEKEIAEAVEAAHKAGCRELVLLHCVSGYPTPPEEMNLAAMAALVRRFDVPVGLSDHTLGIAVPVAAVALGACMIEKHFTLARADGGPDAAFSLEPEEFRRMTEACRTAFAALGGPSSVGGLRPASGPGRGRSPSEEQNRVFRRSLYIVADMEAGERFTAQNLRAIRPGYGLAPKHVHEILGRRASRAIARGEPLDLSMVEREGS